MLELGKAQSSLGPIKEVRIEDGVAPIGPSNGQVSFLSIEMEHLGSFNRVMSLERKRIWRISYICKVCNELMVTAVIAW